MKDIPELGRVPAFVSRYWRIPKPFGTCLICGEKHYHIIAHIMEKHPPNIESSGQAHAPDGTALPGTTNQG